MGFSSELDDLDSDSDLEFGEIDTLEVAADDDAGSEFDPGLEEIDFEALGIDPTSPTEAKPGSEAKVLMLAARYAAGIALWHDEDCYDHGPGAKLRQQQQQRSVAGL